MDEGWPDAVVLPRGEYFHSWEYRKAPKRKGGRVYIETRQTGEVVFHEGYVTAKEAKRLERGEAIDTGPKAPRPEVTSTMQTYIDLHRHAAVRAALCRHPKIALRLMVAHAIVGARYWKVEPEPQTCRNADVRESVETCKGETDFDVKRRAVLDLLNFSPEEPTVTGGNSDDYGLTGLFLALLALSDHAVMQVIAVVMGETLAAGTAAVEAVGSEIGVDMARYWQADDAFFEVLRDKEVLTPIVAEVAGEPIASANAKEPGKVLKRTVRDHLDGANGRPKVSGWVPKWMVFPPSAYTTRGGVGTVKAAALVEAARQFGKEPEPTGPGAVLALPAPAKPEPQPQPEREAA
jgi:ParB family chromosome partitioning protein